MMHYIERQINASLWLLLISVTVFLLSKLLNVLGLWAKARSIPGPPCLSFYGHCDVISRSSLIDILSKSHEKYGSVVKLWLGPSQLLLSIKDRELIKEVLLKAEDKLPLTGRAFRLAFGRTSLFISSFDKVQHRRKLLESELSQISFERASLVPRDALNCILERVRSCMLKGGVNCETVSRHLAFTILGSTLFGDVFLTWPKAVLYEELLLTVARDACFWASYGVAPFWKQEFWRYKQLCAKLKSLTNELVNKCREKYRPNSPFLNFVCHHGMMYEPYGEIISMMFHGSLTMGGLIGNILTRLVTHHEIQDKIYEEISTVHQQSRNQHDFDRMPHLLATVYESARLLPAGPLLQRCCLRHDLTLKDGMIIPAGSILVVPVQLVQMDIASWGNDADMFNPYRFLITGDKSNSDPKRVLGGK